MNRYPTFSKAVVWFCNYFLGISNPVVSWIYIKVLSRQLGQWVRGNCHPTEPETHVGDLCRWAAVSVQSPWIKWYRYSAHNCWLFSQLRYLKSCCVSSINVYKIYIRQEMLFSGDFLSNPPRQRQQWPASSWPPGLCPPCTETVKSLCLQPLLEFLAS